MLNVNIIPAFQFIRIEGFLTYQSVTRYITHDLQSHTGRNGAEEEKGSNLGQTLGVGAAAAIGLAASAYYALYM